MNSSALRCWPSRKVATSRERILAAISDLEHARVFAALGGLAGLWLGAIAGLRWGDLDDAASPLARLISLPTHDGRPTKTCKASRIPVRSVLAAMLTSWRHGWGQVFCRAPTAADPIVPARRGSGAMRLAPLTTGRPMATHEHHPVHRGHQGGVDERRTRSARPSSEWPWRTAPTAG